MPPKVKMEAEYSATASEFKSTGLSGGFIKLEYSTTTHLVTVSGSGIVDRTRAEFAIALQMSRVWLDTLARRYGAPLGDPVVPYAAFYRETPLYELRVGTRTVYVQIVYRADTDMTEVSVTGVALPVNIGSQLLVHKVASDWEQRNFEPPKLAS